MVPRDSGKLGAIMRVASESLTIIYDLYPRSHSRAVTTLIETPSSEIKSLS